MNNKIIEVINKVTLPIKRRVMHMVGRVVVKSVSDEEGLQKLQISVLKDELLSSIERLHDYGFTSNPHSGAEGLCLFLGGNRDHGVIVKVDDRRYRLKGLESGEVALYTDEGDKVHLKRNRVIEVTTETLKVTAGNTKQTLLPSGKIKFENENNELIDILFNLAKDLEEALVITALGPQPFHDDWKEKFKQAKEKIETFKV